MFKAIKYLLILLFIVVVAVAGVLLTLDVNRFKPEIIELVKEKTGREFAINGDLGLALSLIPTVAVNDVTLGNADWAGDENMLSVERFEAQVALMPLLKKNIQVNRLILVKPEIRLETDKQGKGNWVFATDSGKPQATEDAAAPALPALNINEVRIEKADITYKDGKTGKTTRLLIDNVLAGSDSLADPLQLNIIASLNDSPITADATLGSVNDLIANKRSPVKLSATVGAASASLDGTIEQPMQAKGLDLDISFDVGKLSQLNQEAGTELPEAGPIKVTGKLKDTKDGYALSTLTAQLLQFEIKGDMVVSMAGTRPSVTAKLSADQLDITPFQADEKDTKKKKKLFPDDPLPLDGLKVADIDLKFSANRLITKSATLENLKLALALNNGRLSIEPLTARLAGGDVNVSLDLDASSGKSAVLKHHTRIRQLELGQLPDIKKKELITGGKSDIDVNITGKGASVSQIAGSLNGELLVVTGSGKILNSAAETAGSDVVFSALNLVNPMSEKEKHTSMECAVVKFGIKQGLSTTDRGIALRTQRLDVTGSGTIDLKTEALNLAIKPRAREGLGLNVGALVDAVQITGTLAEPSAGVGTEGALTAGLSAGAAVATGGLSLLAQGLFSKSSDGENPCDIALGKAPVKQAAGEKPAEEKSAVESTVDTAKDAVESVTEGASNLLKGLFD